jgi:small GTP-binding protein
MVNKVIEDKCQLLIIGDSTVGKTSILYQYTNNQFLSQHLATVGIDYYNKEETINNKLVRVKIWDTAGQERYKSLTSTFFRNAQGIILVYDVTNPETFDNLKYWIQSINSNLGVQSNVKKIIIGNKIDLPREVPKEEAEALAKEYGIMYFEASAKDNINIKESIMHCVEISIADKSNSAEQNGNGQSKKKLQEKKKEKDGKCC